ncbi:hypothetical protein BGW80DRAFT_1183555 [Lactifluus volemus]|nr:hypothetical protein BGW80DRAFT_1183555 [Lactifluus volemus]
MSLVTIGTYFISKTLPHHSNPDEYLRTTHAIRLLQLHDTAGQGRFSSPSTAYFRGADSHVRRDVNNPAALHALTRWWSEFRTCVPLALKTWQNPASWRLEDRPHLWFG